MSKKSVAIFFCLNRKPESAQNHLNRNDSHDREKDQAQRLIAQAGQQVRPRECAR